jgi:hypothetical protein
MPILLAVRSEPLEEVDSGWQCLCNSVLDESLSGAKVWLVEEVLEIEPSLAPFIHLPPGTNLIRESPQDRWRQA